MEWPVFMLNQCAQWTFVWSFCVLHFQKLNLFISWVFFLFKTFFKENCNRIVEFFLRFSFKKGNLAQYLLIFFFVKNLSLKFSLPKRGFLYSESTAHQPEYSWWYIFHFEVSFYIFKEWVFATNKNIEYELFCILFSLCFTS